MKNRSVTSYIEDHEEEEAKKIVEESLGFPPMKAFSKQLVVKIYVRPDEISTVTTSDGKSISLYMPETISAHDRYRSCIALVMDVAKDCYMGEKYQESGPYCKVGDWIVIPRNVGVQENYRGVPVQIIPENAVYAIIECPTHIERLFKE